jgi:hypothetical protein
VGLTLLAVTSTVGLALSFGAPLPVERPFPPRRSLVGNIWFGVVSAILWAVAVWASLLVASMQLALTTGQVRSSLAADRPSLTQVATVVVIVAWILVIVGPIGALLTLGGRFLVAMVWWTATRQFPVRLFTFLDWALGSGLLRLQGQAYSFRHARLLDVLVSRPTGRRTVARREGRRTDAVR